MKSSAYIVIVFLMAFIAWLIYDRDRIESELKDRDSRDSVDFIESRDAAIRYIVKADRSDSISRALALARADEHAYYARKEASWNRERAALIWKLTAIKTDRATTAWLDSVQLAMLGPPPNNSTHTIPLEYSRMLTGDAMRLPIEQRLATRTQQRLDSAEAHYGRMEASYELDIAQLQQNRADARATIDTLMRNAGDMQGLIDKYRRKAQQNVVISIGAGATATQDGITYGPQVTIGYKIASFRIGKR